MDKIEQAREVSARIWNAGYTDESATIDALIAELEKVTREAHENKDKARWANAELERIKSQEPVAWLNPYGGVLQERITGFDKEHFDIPLFLAAGAQPAPEQEVHDALCPALTGGKCDCTESPVTVDKAWSQFCGGIGRGPDAPYPGMIEAFETHYGQSFTDKDWRNETGIWAAAWSAASAKFGAQPVQQEPFGFFKAEPFGWTDCAETDEGAKALYEAAPAQDHFAGAGKVMEQRKPPIDEFGWRGILAANLKCWHRLTEIESDELISFFADLQEQRKPLNDDEIEQAYRHIYRDLPDDFDYTTYSWIEAGIRYAEAAHNIKEQP